MAFCNSCGANMESGAKFCPKCGASQPGAAAAPVTSVPVQAGSPQSSNTLKVVLIVVAAVVVLGAVAIGTITLIGLRIARHTRVENRDGSVRVEGPLGTFESTSNPSDVARNLGVEVYPGAHVLKGSAANVHVAGVHTVAVELETDDPAEKVADFYKSKLRNANVNVSDQEHYSIVSTDNKNLLTITIEPQGGKTLIHIANISGKGMTGSSSD